MVSSHVMLLNRTCRILLQGIKKNCKQQYDEYECTYPKRPPLGWQQILSRDQTFETKQRKHTCKYYTKTYTKYIQLFQLH